MIKTLCASEQEWLFESDIVHFGCTKKEEINQYLLSFTEHPVFKAPGDGGRGVARGLTSQGDLLLKLRGSLVIQVGNFGLH